MLLQKYPLSLHPFRVLQLNSEGTEKHSERFILSSVPQFQPQQILLAVVGKYMPCINLVQT